MVGAIGRVLLQQPWLQLVLLVLPPLALLVLLALPRRRAGSGAALEASATASALMLATLVVTVLGDGLADVPKQGHLVTNAALAWLIVASSIAVAAA
jgi:hypothetical protein